MKIYGAKYYCAVVKINQQHQRAVETRTRAHLVVDKDDTKAKKFLEFSLNPSIYKRQS